MMSLSPGFIMTKFTLLPNKETVFFQVRSYGDGQYGPYQNP